MALSETGTFRAPPDNESVAIAIVRLNRHATQTRADAQKLAKLGTPAGDRAAILKMVEADAFSLAVYLVSYGESQGIA